MKKNRTEISNFILHTIFLLLLPVTIILFAVLWIFRQLVGLYLQNKLGNKYGGLLSSADKQYVPFDPTCRKVPLVMSFTKSDKKTNFLQIVKTQVEEYVVANTEEHPKLTSTIRCFLGQDYLMKYEVGVSDIVKKLPIHEGGMEIFDEECLKIIVGKIMNAPMPKNDKGLLEIYVPTEPLVQKNMSNGYIYPIVIRAHHSLCDGVRLLNLCNQMFYTTYELNYSSKLKPIKGKSLLHLLIANAAKVLSFLKCLLIGPVIFLNSTILREKDKNLMHGPKLTGEKLVAWSIDDTNRNVHTVKNIKNRVPNTRFTDVVFTCLSASIFNYFRKRNAEIPEKISCMVPLVNLSSIRNAKVKWENDYTFDELNLPIIDSSDLINGLEKIKLSMTALRTSPVGEIAYWIMNYISAGIPHPIIPLLQNTGAYTCIVSCIPGTSRAIMFDDCEVAAEIGTAPHSNGTGVAFTILTYDDKFHICLQVDKALIADQEEVQGIVDDIIANVDLLDKCTKNV